MKTLFRNSLAVALTLALAAGQITASAQTSRRSSTTGENTSTATTSSRSSSAATTSGTTSSRSSSATTGTSSTSSRSSATNPTGSTQVNRGSSATSGTTTGTSRSSATTTSGTTSSRSSATTGTSTTGSRSSATTAPTGTSQVNRGTTTGTSSTTSRSSATTGSASTRPTSSATQSTTTSRTSGTTGTSATTSRSSVTTGSTTTGTSATTSRASATTANTTVSNATTARRSNSTSSVTSKGLTAVSSTRSTSATTTSNQPENMKGAQAGVMTIDNGHNVNRIPPRQRDFVTYDKPGCFYGSDPHRFGYRVETLPRKFRRASYWGIDYYYYNDVFYRYYNNHYVVCRPPIGHTWRPRNNHFAFPVVQFAYYHTTHRPIGVEEMYWRTINRQNEAIARNNAILAQQYASLALNTTRALSAREIADRLGLVQSYAHINDEYYYQDGVFFSYLYNGRYEVIVPPAGALVSELPDDYDIIVLNGVEYYKVDDTVYRLTLVDGTPLLEVLGQMYGSMATRYNYYL